MKNKFKSPSTVAVFIMLAFVFFFVKCINNQTDKVVSNEAVPTFKNYAGDASCANCHKDIYESHIKTAHFHTSEIATANSIKGSFAAKKNTFVFNTGGVMVMEHIADSFFQTAYVNGVLKKSESFDIVTGSGKKGQSYLSWIHNNRLVQLPMTYFTDSAQWCTSPGYPDKIAAFNRPITSRCLECHTTYVERLSEPDKDPELFDKNKMILGVGCEKCHGPAAKHVEFQTQNRAIKTAKYIINPARFTRQQSLDMCALCHGGRLQKSKPSFSFIAGDNLADYFTMDTVKNNFSYVDVHGNQLGLLIASKCFRMSATLTCVTCHNSHNNEQGEEALFSQRCRTCHNNSHTGSVSCKMTAQLGDEIKNNCISCHMPLQKSLAISVLLQGYTRLTQASMHTHLIKVYPDETQMVLNFIKHK